MENMSEGQIFEATLRGAEVIGEIVPKKFPRLFQK
jgi:hypothetical protein